MEAQLLVNAQQGGLTTRQLQGKLAEFGWTAIFTDENEMIISSDVEVGDMMTIYAWPSDTPIAALLHAKTGPGQRIGNTTFMPHELCAVSEVVIIVGDRKELLESLEAYRDEYTPEALAFLQDAVIFYTLDQVGMITPQSDLLYRDVATAITLLTDGMWEQVDPRECRFARELIAPAEPLAQRLPAPPKAASAGCLGALLGIG